MTIRLNKPVALSVFLLVLASLQKPVPADQSTAVAPREYTAVYEVLRNGEQVANITLDLSRQGDEWAFHGFTHDMRGLGKLLDVEGRQGVTGNPAGQHRQQAAPARQQPAPPGPGGC